MATLILGYDTEFVHDPDLSLKGVEVLTSLHEKFGIPATFFLVGSLVEKIGSQLKSMLSQDYFDIQQHTYSHILLKNNKIFGHGVSLDKIREEIEKTNSIIENIFNQQIIGLRAPVGFYNGLREEKEILHVLWTNGIKFVSSNSRGFHDTLPSPLTQPYWYEEEGFSELLEIPAHDWHDCCLKGYVKDAIGWPLNLPWPIPSRPPTSPEEEFAVYKKSFDFCIENNLMYAPTLHPWSLYKLDKYGGTVRLLLEYARKRDIEIISYKQLYLKMRRSKEGR